MTSKKILSSLLAVSMLASMLPTNLMAVAGDPPTVEIKSGTDEAKTGTGSMTITLSIPFKNAADTDFDYSAPTALTYDGTNKTATVRAKDSVTGMGEVTVHYYSDSACTTEAEVTETKNVGTYYVGITLAAGTHYGASTSVIHGTNWKFELTKANITPSVSIDNWTYGETAKTPSLGQNSNPGNGAVTYEYKVKSAGNDTYSENVPTDAGDYTVRATVAATTNYNGGTATANFTINKATATATVTKSENLTYNKNAQDLITAGSAQHGTIKYAVTANTVDTAPADDSADWKTGIPQKTNAGKYKVWYKAFATENNYCNSDAAFVEVEIAKATVTIAAKDQSISVGDAVPTLGNDSYTVTGLIGTDALTNDPTLKYQKNNQDATPSNTAAGTYDIVPSGANAGNNYSISYTKGTLTISNKNTQTITANNVTATYGDTNKSVSASTNGGGAISYAVKNGSEEYISVDATTGALTINKVPTNGVAYVIVTAAETQTYAQATKEVTITINKASALIKAPTSKNPTRYSSAVQLINAGTVEDGCKIEYSLGTNTAPGETWETDATKIIANKSGTFYVWYKVTGTDNYEGVEPETPITVKVSQGSTYSSQTWTLTMDSYEYDGTAHTPTINGRAYTYSSTQVQYTYYNADTNEELDGAPSAIGNYKVKVYADGGSSYYGRTQYATYSITDPIDANGMAKVDAFKENDTVPVSDGKIFAGWFTDETCTTAYTEDTGKAYAKFIDENILTVKAQISSGTTANSASTSIRFITSVDSLKYQNVGFKITFNGKTIDKKMTKVYTALNANGKKVYPNVFSEDSNYMEAYTLNNIPQSAFGKEFTVTPYYTTQDGTIVEGATNTFTIANMIKRGVG